MRTPAQRGAVGNWLRDERLARKWTSAAVARRNLERAGIKVAASVYAEWESGTRIPSERQQEALEAFYGSRPGAQTTGGDTAAIVKAIEANTAAILRNAEATEAFVKVMAGRMDLLEKSQRKDFDALVRAIGEQLAPVVAAAGGLAPNESLAHDKDPVSAR